MASGPELFVVCKNCNAEVSPYITECPYCGARLRKRAPKLDQSGAPRQGRRERPRLSRLKPGEIPGVRPDWRPYATIALVLVALVVTLGYRAGLWDPSALILGGPYDGEWWRGITTVLVYGGTGYEIVALGAIFLFGWLLERRHGPWAPLLVFLAGAAAGSGLVIALDEGALAVGGNSAALALLAAWSVHDLLARRRGEEDEADMLGVLVLAVVLVLLPLATDEAHSLAGLGGGLAGLLLGLPLARLADR